jgi:hypothetical protein
MSSTQQAEPEKVNTALKAIPNESNPMLFRTLTMMLVSGWRGLRTKWSLSLAGKRINTAKNQISSNHISQPLSF